MIYSLLDTSNNHYAVQHYVYLSMGSSLQWQKDEHSTTHPYSLLEMETGINTLQCTYLTAMTSQLHHIARHEILLLGIKHAALWR